jgi:hypothetical protein
MFNTEIEGKIIDFVKKSPIGVTSGELAKSIGLNRMTMTKYLAIIKEKALIDFKQFGMAKLWYIPVKLSKESFLTQVNEKLINSLQESQIKILTENIGDVIGNEINQMYLKFYVTGKMSLDQISSTFEDVGSKLGGLIKTNQFEDRIESEIVQNPFEDKKSRFMLHILSKVFYTIFCLNHNGGEVLVVGSEKSPKIIIKFSTPDKKQS